VDDVWKYNQTTVPANNSWTLLGFNDSGTEWQSGAGLIYHETATLPWPKNTELSDASHPYSNTKPSYYFRRVFNVADPSSFVSLKLRYLIDDGAVFYLNGHELPRYNMPNGTITPTTLASSNIADATTISSPVDIPVSYLVAGNNVLAVEVHQNFGTGTTSTDVVFGVTLDGVQNVATTPPPPLRVTELMYNPSGSPNVNGDENEFVELQNVGASPLNLTGYRFTAGIEFTFGNVTLAPGAKTVVVKDLASFQARYGDSIAVAGEYLDSLDNNGEVIRLEDNKGVLIQDFTYSDAWYPSTDGKGDSLVINNPLADPTSWVASGAWHASTAALGTPGIDETTVPPQHAVVVNEVLANSPTGANDWIELKNLTGAAIDIGGWYLSDSGADLMKYRIPAGTIIPAGGFVTFEEQSTFGSAAQGANAFSLSSAGDDVYVSSSSTPGVLGAYRDVAHFGASDPNVTMGRYTTSDSRADFVALSKSTKGADNAPPVVGPVVINEMMYHPDGSGDEWIELKNVAPATVALDNWRFTNGVDFTFPVGTSIAPGELILVIPGSITVADFRAKYGIPASVQVIGGYAGALSNSGEHVELSKPGEPQPDLSIPYVLVDDVDYGAGGTWPASPDGDGPSLARFVESSYGNDVANWRGSTTVGGTPGTANDISPVTTVGRWLEVSSGRLLFQFSKDVGPSFSVDDVQLTNLTTGQDIAKEAMSVSYDPASNIATITFPGLAGGHLSAGRYRAALLAAGINDGYQQLDGNADGAPGDNYSVDFVHLPGDLNGDGKVDFIDFQALELNFDKSDASWADGDFNYDGRVDHEDFDLLRANFGTDLSDAAAPAPTPAPVTSVQLPAPPPVSVAPKPIAKPAPRPRARPAVAIPKAPARIPTSKTSVQSGATTSYNAFSAKRITRKRPTSDVLLA
jgi:hypothetical protein